MNRLKKFILAASMSITTFVLLVATGCSGDYREEIDELKKRVADIETTLDALEAKFDAGLLVTSVTPLPDETGYEITFSDDTRIEIVNGSGQSDENPILEVIVDDEKGTVTFVMNDEGRTRVVFPLGSSAQSIAILTDVVAFNGSESVEVLFRVNPSSAWVPTGTGNAIKKWTLDQIGTRASYLNPAEAFTIESITPDGDKAGQYVAAIAGDAFKHNPDVEEYLMALVLENGGGDDDEIYISSGMFRVMQSGHALTDVIYDAPVYNGDFWGNGTTNFSLRFNGGIDWNDINSAGYNFTVDFTSPAVDAGYDVQYLQIPNGTYNFDGGKDAWSIYVGDVWEYLGGGANTFYYLGNGSVQSGTMTIEGGPREYIVEFDIVVRGGKTIRAKYEGEIVAGNPNYWSYSDDLDVTFGYAHPKVTRDEYGYNGDLYGTGAANFRIFFQNFDNSSTATPWNGWEMAIDLQTTPVEDGIYTDCVEIPSGTYTFDNSKAPGTVVMGSNTYAISVVNSSSGVAAPIVGGTATISGNSAGYDMTIEMELANNTTFTGRYQGALAMPNPYGLPPLDPAMAAPTGLEIVRVSPVGGTLAWDNAGAQGWAFRIQGNLNHTTEGLTNEYVEFWRTANAGYGLDGLLLPGNTYTWQVAGIKDGKRSAWVDGPEITTPAPPAEPINLEFTRIAQWESVQGLYGTGTVDGWWVKAHEPTVRVENGNVLGTGWFIETLFHVPPGAGAPGQIFIPRPYTINLSQGNFTVMSGTGYGGGGTILHRIENDAEVRQLYVASGNVTASYVNAVYTLDFDALDTLGDRVTLKIINDTFNSSGAPRVAGEGMRIFEPGFKPEAARPAAPVSAIGYESYFERSVFGRSVLGRAAVAK